jgi:hypothetical protein
MKPRAEHHPVRRGKLPPILEIDEDGVPVSEPLSWRPRWSSDGEEPGVTLEDWPGEYED